MICARKMVLFGEFLKHVQQELSSRAPAQYASYLYREQSELAKTPYMQVNGQTITMHALDKHVLIEELLRDLSLASKLVLIFQAKNWHAPNYLFASVCFVQMYY